MSLSSPPPSILPSFSPFGPPKRTRSSITLITHQWPTQTSGVSGANAPSQQGPGNPLASAALYLYTFLATLVLLVGISLFIIVRSIIQRRRRTRAVREAWLRYTNGREGDVDLIRFMELRMNQAGVATRAGRVDLSKVPRMWEVHLVPRKSVDSEKTPEGKLISSSWKPSQRSKPYLDLKSSLWAWSSILPLSSSPLSDQATASNEGGTTSGSATTTPVNLNGTRTLPLSGVGRFVGRILYGSDSVQAPAGQGSHDQTRPDAPVSASPSTTANNPNSIPIDSVEGSTPPLSRSDNRHTNTDTQLEEGTFHMRGSSGSSSHPPNSNTTNPSINQTLPNIGTTTLTEKAESSSTHPSDQQPGQGIYVSHKIPSNLINQIQSSNHNPLTTNQNQENKHVDNAIRMRVAVLVRMPTPPTSLTPSLHSGFSNAKSKAKVKAETEYYEPKDSAVDEKRLCVSTFGGGDDHDTDEVQMPLLEVGLVDVDVFPGGGGEGWREKSSDG